MLSLFPLVVGCNSEATEPTPNIGVTNTAVAVLPVTNEVAGTDAIAAGEAAEAAEAVDVTNNMPAPPPGVFGKPPPSDVPLSGPVTEVVKLVDAGVSEDVMLSYVKNSASSFDLGSQQIIYLNDIGVPDSIINAMMQRDQALKSSLASYSAPTAQPAIVDLPPETEETSAPVEDTSAVAEPGPTVVNYNYFYETLSPYGTWVEVDNYGWCWRPTVVVVNPGWRPYCDRGRWVYTDSGWYWYSDYTWGAVAFHYGRWFNHPRLGWCWWPDRTWGPAWVSWRYDNSYCGWAPLPPSARFSVGVGLTFGGGFSFNAGWFTFVPWRSFSHPHPWRYCVPRNRLVVVYNNTRPCNDIRSDGRHRVFNHGIAPERVSEFTHEKVRHYTLRDRNEWRGQGTRRDHIDHVNRTVFESRPPVQQGTFTPGHGRQNRTQFESRKRGGEAAFTPTSSTGPANRTQFESRPTGQEGLFTPPPRENASGTQPHWSDRKKTEQPQARPAPPAQDNRTRSPQRDNRRDNDNSGTEWRHRGAPANQAQAPSTPVVQAPVVRSQPERESSRSSVVIIGRDANKQWQNRRSSTVSSAPQVTTTTTETRNEPSRSFEPQYRGAYTPQYRGNIERNPQRSVSPTPTVAPHFAPRAQTFTPPVQVQTPAPRPSFTPPARPHTQPPRQSFSPPARSEPRQEQRAPAYSPPPRSSPPPQSAPPQQSSSGSRESGRRRK